MKLAIVGSRNFTDYNRLKSVIDVLRKQYNVTKIISGGASGADSLAAKYAEESRIKLKEFLPDWNKFGKAAGFKRNVFIVEDCNYLVAFWDGQSKGTKISIDLAKSRKKKVNIYYF